MYIAVKTKSYTQSQSPPFAVVISSRHRGAEIREGTVQMNDSHLEAALRPHRINRYCSWFIGERVQPCLFMCSELHVSALTGLTGRLSDRDISLAQLKVMDHSECKAP